MTRRGACSCGQLRLENRGVALPRSIDIHLSQPGTRYLGDKGERLWFLGTLRHPRLQRRPPTVDDEALAGHRARLVGGEEERGIRDILRIGHELITRHA